MDELDLSAAESRATYDEIKAYVLEKYGVKVSSLYISQVKFFRINFINNYTVIFLNIFY